MIKRRYGLFIALALAAVLSALTCFARNPVVKVATAAARVRHVFIIVLENKDFSETFGTSPQDPYLRKTLVPMGALLRQYYGTGHASLDNYISLISGQAANRDTSNDCVTATTASSTNYNNIVETGTSADGQVIASGGCIYPAHVKTLADQLNAAGLRWKGYMEDMGNNPARESATCGHPPIGIGTDDTSAAEGPSAAVPQGDAYATRHNPFMYFHSIIDSPGCAANVVNLEHLEDDLAHSATTPNLVFITPNLCHDGHDGSGTGAAGTTCANGEPGGLTSADAFLRKWVPLILKSPAYKADGLLVITFDEGNYTTSASKDAGTGRTMLEIRFPGQACCNQRPGPNLSGVRPGKLTVLNTPAQVVNLVVDGYGGDRIGALLLSPFVKAGSISEVPYNHYSLLRSLEDIFRLDPHLGYAADNAETGYSLQTLGNDAHVFESLVKSK